jgi:hypothetical protein
MVSIVRVGSESSLQFAASLYSMNGPPVSTWASRIAYHSF